MEKEALISQLKSRAAVDNLSDRSYEEVANLFASTFADDTKITDESWGTPVSILKTMSGQLRHDVSNGITTFKTQFESEQAAKQQEAINNAIAAAKAEWEKQHPTPPTPPTPPAGTPPANQEPQIDGLVTEAVNKALGGILAEDGAIGKLGKQLNDLVTQIKQEKQTQTEDAIRNEIRSYLISRGVEEDDFALDYTMEKVVIGEKPDVAALKAKAEKDYETYYKKIHKNAAGSPFGGGAGGGEESSSAASWLQKNGTVIAAEQASAEARKKLLK